MANDFHAAYRRWQEACLVEYNERFHEQRTLITTDDYDPDMVVEFAEDGTAYPHGAAGTNYVKNAVTPWDRSPHYVR
jgi:hypothetical protein